MSNTRTLRKILAFFWRDLAIARGYRGALVLEVLEAFFGVATFYYLSRFVDSPELAAALPHGSNYFAFALVGFAFFDYLSVSISAFESSLEEARHNRTLEALLVTQTPLGDSRRLLCISVRGSRAPNVCLPRLGSVAFWLYAPFRQLGGSGSDSARIRSRVCRTRNSVGQLPDPFQARQSRKVARARHLWPRGRNDVPGGGLAPAPANPRATHSSHIFARGHARSPSWGRRMARTPAILSHPASLRCDPDTILVRDFFLVPPPY